MFRTEPWNMLVRISCRRQSRQSGSLANLVTKLPASYSIKLFDSDVVTHNCREIFAHIVVPGLVGLGLARGVGGS